MGRSRRNEVSIFNFSFVDIMATTIGVLLFIMVLALLNSANRFSGMPKQEALQQLAAAAGEASAQAEILREKAAAQQEIVQRYQQPVKSAEAALADAKSLEQRRSDLVREEERLSKRLQELAAGETALKDELRELMAQAQNRETKRRGEVQFRVPEVRETDKSPVVFECDGGEVYLLAYESELNEDAYTATSLGSAALIERRGNANGETYGAACKPRAQFDRVFRRMKPGKQFASFIVRDDSYDLFRQLRQEVFWAAGYDVQWQAYAKEESIIFGIGSGGGGTVQ